MIFLKKMSLLKQPLLKKKSNIDRSIPCSLDGPIQFLHADFANLEFLGKSAGDMKYCLLFFDLCTSKVYIYPVKWRRFIANKMYNFYKEVNEKRYNKHTRLQTDKEFIQNEIKMLNEKYIFRMFLTSVRGGKAFSTKQKIRELKKRIFRVKSLKNSNKKNVQQQHCSRHY